MRVYQRRRRLISLAGVLALLFGAAGWLSPQDGAVAQGLDPIWIEPINLSESGAASQPQIAAEANGAIHILWWDRFDGAKYSFYLPEIGWSRQTNVSTIFGGRTNQGGLTPPKNLIFLADGAGSLHAFWINDDNNLSHARSRAGTGDWGGATTIATTPLSWDVSIDADNRLHVSYIRPTQSSGLPAGVYYRQSLNSGQLWSNAVLVAESLYFRTLGADAAHTSVASAGGRDTIVTWDDPQLGQSLYSRMSPQALRFEPPVLVDTQEVAAGAPAQRMRLAPLAGQGFLAIWQAGAGCALYQQIVDPTAQVWSPPVRVLDSLRTCPTTIRSRQTADNQLFAVLDLGTSGLALVYWDGNTWSEPFTSQISFVNPLTNRSTNLGCLNVTLAVRKVAVVGCDGNGDVWTTSSQLDLADLLPALETAWSAPQILSVGSGDAGLPVMAVDSDGLTHVLWSESPATGGPPNSITYARSDGEQWVTASGLLRSPSGKAERPSLVADRGGMLHAVWSGDIGGAIFYSQAFVRDATANDGWTTPRALPAPRAVGGWPTIAMDSKGWLHVVYAVPINEDRGLYYVQSQDQGATWTAPVRIFDAALAEWAMVGETRMLLDSADRIHVMWERRTLPDVNLPLALYYAQTVDDGQTWTEPTVVDTGEVHHGRLVAASASEIHRLWSRQSLGRLELWHQVSPDGGANWTEARRTLDTTSSHAADISLVSDGQGLLIMNGIERTAENSAVLFLLRWNGESWVDRERVGLGFDPTTDSGATALLLPGGDLGAFYRVLAPAAGGLSRYVVGFIQRPIEAGPVVALPTFTPPPPNTPVPTRTPVPTLEPTATPQLNTAVQTGPSDDLLLRIGGIVAAMLLVSVLAVGRLLGARRR